VEAANTDLHLLGLELVGLILCFFYAAGAV